MPIYLDACTIKDLQESSYIARAIRPGHCDSSESLSTISFRAIHLRCIRPHLCPALSFFGVRLLSILPLARVFVCRTDRSARIRLYRQGEGGGEGRGRGLRTRTLEDFIEGFSKSRRCCRAARRRSDDDDDDDVTKRQQGGFQRGSRATIRTYEGEGGGGESSRLLVGRIFIGPMVARRKWRGNSRK